MDAAEARHAEAEKFVENVLKGVFGQDPDRATVIAVAARVCRAVPPFAWTRREGARP